MLKYPLFEDIIYRRNFTIWLVHKAVVMMVHYIFSYCDDGTPLTKHRIRDACNKKETFALDLLPLLGRSAEQTGYCD